MLATEEQPSPIADRPHSPLLESWSHNERMRHVPSIAWIVEKIDVDLRRRIDALWTPFIELPFSDPRHESIEREFVTLCRFLDRVAEVARHGHGHPHPPNDLGNRVQWSIGQAVSGLTAANADTFGRRFPFQTFERSNAEPLWAAVLAAIQHVHKLADLIREIDPQIDERMYEGLVQLTEPLRREPIA